MRVLSIVGKTDKRLLTYPLMHILALAGRTIVITDDVTYRHLYRGFTNHGEIHDLTIMVEPSLDEKKITEMIGKLDEDECDFCLVITDIIRCPNADTTLCVCAKSKSFLGVKIDEFSEKEPNAFKTFISINEINKKEWLKLGVMPLQWTAARFSYIYECEERKELLPFSDKDVLVVLETVFLKDLNITAKTFHKLAKRKLT